MCMFYALITDFQAFLFKKYFEYLFKSIWFDWYKDKSTHIHGCMRLLVPFCLLNSKCQKSKLSSHRNGRKYFSCSKWYVYVVATSTSIKQIVDCIEKPGFRKGNNWRTRSRREREREIKSSSNRRTKMKKNEQKKHLK